MLALPTLRRAPGQPSDRGIGGTGFAPGDDRGIGGTGVIGTIRKFGSIVVNGEVTGDITAKHSVEIHAPGKLRGNMTTPQLLIDKGVIFEGTCKMEEAQSSKPPAAVTLLSNRDKDST